MLGSLCGVGGCEKGGALAPRVIGLVFPSMASLALQQPGWVSLGTGIVSAQRAGKAGCFPVKASLFKFKLLFKKQNVKKQHGSSISGLLGEMLKVGS